MSVAALRARYARVGHEARVAAVERLSPIAGVEFELTEISGRALDGAAIWQNGYYDWRAVLRHFSSPDRFDAALWANGEVLALGLATTRPSALKIELIEGNPDKGSPLTGSRLPVMFDVFANYARLRSRAELHLEAKNATLATLYESAYGFERVHSAESALYWRRRV